MRVVLYVMTVRLRSLLLKGDTTVVFVAKSSVGSVLNIVSLAFHLAMRELLECAIIVTAFSSNNPLLIPMMIQPLNPLSLLKLQERIGTAKKPL